MNKQFNNQIILVILLISGLIIARIIYSGSYMYIFLLWNLFLAWIPYSLSEYFQRYEKVKKMKYLFIFAAWLLFFPNALYIVTDLIHLRLRSNVPGWYDVLLLFSSSFAGLMMAFVSLQRVEAMLSKIFKPMMVQIQIGFLLVLGAFGVYLGRFERWNSWDILHNPFTLAEDILYKILLPHENLHTWGFTFVLSVFYGVLFMLLKMVPKHSDQENLNY